MAKAEILIVEDDNIIVMELRDRLQGLGYAVCAVASYGKEAIEKAGEIRPDLVLMDIRLKGTVDGIAAAAKIRDLFDIPVVYLTALVDKATFQRARATEPYGYLMKPFDSTELYAVIETALHKHRLETGLRESEEKYRRVVEQSSDGIVLTDEEGAIIEWNPAAEQITGLRQTEVLGCPIWDIQFQVVPEEQRSSSRYEQTKRIALDLLRTGEASWLHQLEEVEMQRPDGARRTIQTSGFVIPTDQGFRAGSVIRDITDRKRAEEALRESEAKYRSLVEQSLQGIVIAQGPPLRLVFANPAYAEIMGFTLEEAMSLSPEEVEETIHPEDRASILQRFRDLLAGEPPRPRVARVIRKDGEMRWLEMFASRIEYQGKPVLQVAVVDVTERRQVEEALGQHTAQLEALRQVGLELTAQLDLDALLHSIVSRAVELVQEASGGLHLYRPERDVLEWAMVVGPHEAPTGTILYRGEGLSGRVWETGEPLVVDDYQAWEGKAAVWEDYIDGSVVGVPVCWGEEFLGVLNVVADPPRTFSPPDVELLGLFATQAAIAMRNARLYEEARRRAEELQLLFEATRDVSASLELDEVLECVAAHLCRAAEATSGDILTLDESGEQATVQAQYWSPDASLLERASDVGTVYDLTQHPAILQAMRENRPLVTHADDSDLEAATREMMARFGGRSALRIPIHVTRALRGYALLWDSQRRHEWTDEEVRLCQTLANQAAIAIENARLYEKAQQEIAERMRAEEIIKLMAYHDDLTGLPNRRLFNDRLNLEMAHAQRNRQKLAVMLLDLDHFKKVNDTLGHSVGDRLLQAVGNRLTGLLRKGDTVARMGGDEFMLLLPGIPRLEDATRTARKILEAFRRPVEFDSHELRITTSIGITLYPDDGEDSDTLMKNADIAMYRAKGEGRDNYQRYTSWE